MKLKKGNNKPEIKKPPQTKQVTNKPNEKQDQPPKQEINEELEKKMLEGQEHIEIKPDENKNVEQPPEPVKEVPKKPIILKPRETYLQEKITKLNPNKNLMSSIKNEMGNKIKTMINDENILITEVPKDLNKYIPKNTEGKTLSAEGNYLNKKKYKDVKKIRYEIIVLKKTMEQLLENERLLNNEEFVKLNDSQKGYEQNSDFDKSVKEQKLKTIKDKKKLITEKIKLLENQLKTMLGEEPTTSNQEKLQSFIDNFNRDKEIVEGRAKKFYKESKEREQRMRNDITKIMEKRKKEIEDEEKEIKNKKDEHLKELKDTEKKQSQLNKNIFDKYKDFHDKKLEHNGKTYLYNQRYENFKKNEDNYFKTLSRKNKEAKDKVTYKYEDIQKFSEEFGEKIENRKYDQELKNMELYKKWAENKEKLPKSNYKENDNEEDNENKANNEEKRTAIQLYGENVREKRMPTINETLKKQREQAISSLDQSSINKKHELQKHKKKKIIFKKIDESKPSKFKWKLKIEDPVAKMDEVINKNLVHKPKKIVLLPICKTSSNIPDIKHDYLREIIDKRKEKEKEKERTLIPNNEGNSKSQMFNVKKMSNQWKQAINKSGSVFDNLVYVRGKMSLIDEEANQKEKLLKIKGGLENNPDLGREVGSLLLNSIEARINILERMRKDN